jgi:hypothetical protein
MDFSLHSTLFMTMVKYFTHYWQMKDGHLYANLNTASVFMKQFSKHENRMKYLILFSFQNNLYFLVCQSFINQVN